MATDPELEFEFFLASKLGKTVAQLREEMGLDEFIYWVVHYGREAQRKELAAQGR